MKRMRKSIKLGLLSLLCAAFCGLPGAFVATGAAAAEQNRDNSEMVEIEYGGKLISVDIADLILMQNDDGSQSVELGYPEKYEEQLQSAPRYGHGKAAAADADEGDGGTDAFAATPNEQGAGAQEISKREYDEEQRARTWANIAQDLTLREVDRKALELVKEYGEAKAAVPPMLGSTGSVVITYSSYAPRLVCRPMYVTDVILQPGEVVTGVHPGDPVRWQFVPSFSGGSGTGGATQTHVLIKPLMADISTNLIVNTDRRTYQFDLVASATDHMPSVSFAYPDDSLKEWDAFMAKRREEKSVLASGYSIDPEDLHLDYEIRGKDTLRWKPVRVWDDGVKTYIQFKPGSTIKSVEAPIFVVYEHKKQIIANYRAANDMYVVDRTFDKAALIVGTGAHQDRVVLTRLSGKSGKSKG